MQKQQSTQRLILNPEILRVAAALTWNHPRGFEVVANICYPNADGLELHGGHKGWFKRPHHQYQVANDEIFASFFNLTVSLVDMPPGKGFACIPGSHTFNFQYPEHITLDDPLPMVHNVLHLAGGVWEAKFLVRIRRSFLLYEEENGIEKSVDVKMENW